MTKEKILDIIKSSKTIDSVYDIKLNKGQGNNAASATRKDYVDGEIAKQVSKSGDTMTGSLITSGSLVADGVIRTKYSVETYDTSSAYGIRDTILGSTAYIQAGKVNKDVADQKLMLSGWLGTPLTMSKFSMANGVNPQVTWGSTNHDILHRGNLPNAAEVGAVNKTGDTMTGHLRLTNNAVVEVLSSAGYCGVRMSGEGEYAIMRRMPAPEDGIRAADHIAVWANATTPGRLYFRRSRANQTTAYDDYQVYHQGFKPTAADVGAVSKAGDTMTGNLSFSDTGEGVRFTAFSGGTGIYNGTGDAATQDMTNIQIKSWYGIGIAPTAGLLPSMTMGQNSVWINARTGDITTIGSVTANGFKSTNAYAYFSEKAGHGMYLGTTTDNRTVMGGGGSDGIVVIRPLGTGISTAQTIFEANGTIWNPIAPTNASHLTNKEYVDSEVAKLLARIVALESKITTK